MTALPLPLQFAAAWIGTWIARHQERTIEYLRGESHTLPGPRTRLLAVDSVSSTGNKPTQVAESRVTVICCKTSKASMQIGVPERGDERPSRMRDGDSTRPFRGGDVEAGGARDGARESARGVGQPRFEEMQELLSLVSGMQVGSQWRRTAEVV
jgi:hypothetical protein